MTQFTMENLDWILWNVVLEDPSVSDACTAAHFHDQIHGALKVAFSSCSSSQWFL